MTRREGGRDESRLIGLTVWVVSKRRKKKKKEKKRWPTD
jgi:hypothetical protein